MEKYVVKNELQLEEVIAGTANYDTFLVLDTNKVVVRRTAVEVVTELGAITTYNAGDNYAFKTIGVNGQTSVVAASNTDTLTLVEGTNITITTNNVTKAITINSTGGGTAVNKFTFMLDASRGESVNIPNSYGALYTFRMPYNFHITHTCATITRYSEGADLLIDILTSPDTAANLESIYDTNSNPDTLAIRELEDSSYTFSIGQPIIQYPDADINYLVSINTSYNGTPTELAQGLKVYITGNIL